MGKRLLTVVHVFAFLFLFAFNSAQAQERSPKISLPKALRGQAAVQGLGSNLVKVARAHGKSKAELIRNFRQDKDLLVDKQGRLAYTCKVQAAGAAAASAATAAGASYPLDQTFFLHSRPAASKRIFLDFDGAVTRGTAWNSQYAGGADIVSQPYDIDANPAAFSSTELENIQNIWRRVAEDYAPFDVDVTTQDPGIPVAQYGSHAVITPSNFYGNAGGVAYLGIFASGSADYYSPAWVFSSSLGNGNEKYVAEAISHEVGHNFGLSHDGKVATGTSGAVEYYNGQGDWAPIMGVGYYKSVTQFSKGEYAGANNTQDDLAIIAGKAPYRADEPLRQLAGSAFNASGVISQRSDVDTFAFDAGSGPIDLRLWAPDSRSSNVNIKAELLDAQGSVVLSSDPGTSIEAALIGTIAAGSYTVRIDGAGHADPLSTGYSDYASLGQYSLTGTVPPLSAGTPVAQIATNISSGIAPLTVSFSGASSYDPDGSIVSFSWDFGDGASASGAAVEHVYDRNGEFIAALTVTDDSGLSAKATVRISVALPPNQLPVAVISALSATSGLAPLTVNLSGANSYDTDGSISTYSWNFGDGSSASGAEVSHTYNQAGSYSARLTVTDNRGGTANVTISIVASPDPTKVISVSSISLSKVTSGNNMAANAQIAIRDAAGLAVSGATVTVQWSGIYKATVSGTTDANGVASFTSKFGKRGGTISIKVNNVSAPAYTYNAAMNVQSSASMSLR